MTNQEIHQAFNNLYQIARMAQVNAEVGDLRERHAQILSLALHEKYSLVEKQEPEQE